MPVLFGSAPQLRHGDELVRKKSAAYLTSAGGHITRFVHAHVTLLVRNNKLGIKILMSGGGRCNITNTGDVRHLVNYFPGSGRFLYSAFRVFSNDDVIQLLSTSWLRSSCDVVSPLPGMSVAQEK